jgi:hypothetical protein
VTLFLYFFCCGSTVKFHPKTQFLSTLCALEKPPPRVQLSLSLYVPYVLDTKRWCIFFLSKYGTFFSRVDIVVPKKKHSPMSFDLYDTTNRPIIIEKVCTWAYIVLSSIVFLLHFFVLVLFQFQELDFKKMPICFHGC